MGDGETSLFVSDRFGAIIEQFTDKTIAFTEYRSLSCFDDTSIHESKPITHPPESYGRYVAVAILGIGPFIPGHVVRSLILSFSSEAVASVLEPYGLLLPSIGPAPAPVARLVVKRWYDTSAAVGATALLVAIYSIVFYTLEQSVTVDQHRRGAARGVYSATRARSSSLPVDTGTFVCGL